MKFKEILVLLPCHSLDDFPMYYEGEQADGLLAAYSAMWHPALISHTGKLPGWRRSDEENEDLADHLIVLPQVCQDDLPGFWMDEARQQGATVIACAEIGHRRQLVDALLSELDEKPAVDNELVDDFLALGLGHLWTEVLTIQMRYSSLIDDERFQSLVVAAAQAALAGDAETARDKLSSCFDCLAESKDHYYPVDAYLIDLTLVASTTLDQQLAHELQRKIPTNLLISGDDLAQLAHQNPETLAALRRALDEGRVDLVGGERNDLFPLSLASVDAVAQHLADGQAVYQELLGRTPNIFGRRRAGLTPLLPQLLVKHGFVGALHFTLDGGRFPSGYQSKIRWQGVDDTGIDALTRAPVDAALPETFLSLPRHLSESMDSDHVAAVCLAHWPGGASDWYRDLQRIASYSPVLGKFVTLEQFFDETGLSSDPSKFEPDEYRTPWLQRAVRSGEERPASAMCESVQAEQQRYCYETLDTLNVLLTTRAGDAKPQESDGESAMLDRVLEQFAAALPRTAAPPQAGFLVANPYSFSRQVVVDAGQLNHPPATDDVILLAAELETRRQVIVNLPPVGYAWVAGDETQSWSGPPGKPMVEDLTLRCEHFEIRIDERTGGIHAVHNFRQRGNLLTQRLGMRLPTASRKAGDAWRRTAAPDYSAMVADEISVADRGPATASITSHGRLLGNDDTLLARFTQTVSVMRTSPVFTIDVQLDPVVQPEGNPWESYYALRLAFSDAAPEIFRGIGLGSHATQRRRPESPHFVELRGASTTLTLLTGGLPFHECIGDRQLDSLLIVPGETARRFRLGIGVNMTHATAAALEFSAPQLVHFGEGAAPSPTASWLFRVDARNVVATRWRPHLVDGQVRGVTVRLLESAGRATKCGLHAFREMEAASKLDFSGAAIGDLQIDQQRVMIELERHEMCDVQLVWKDG